MKKGKNEARYTLKVAGSVVVWARLSLGRNIGLMRHPVYTGMLLSHIAFFLRAFSPLKALLMGLNMFWFIPIKVRAGLGAFATIFALGGLERTLGALANSS